MFASQLQTAKTKFGCYM